MTRHFAFFIACTVRNRLMRQLRRLRSPRYAAAALVGVAYFFFIFGGWMPSADAGDAIGGQWISVGRVAGPLMLGLLAAWWWLWGGHRYGLRLSPAETDLLVTAPVTRRQLIRFKVLQAQPGILFSAALGALIMRGTALPWPLRLLSLWLLLATLHQHQIAASLVHASADEHGRRGIRRNLVPIVLFGTAFSALLWALLRAVGDIRGRASLDYAAERVVALLAEPGPRWALAPFRLLLAPTLAPDAAAWLLPFAAALGILLVHYIWLQRTDTAFEETAAREGQQREELVAALRAGGLSGLSFTRAGGAKPVAKPWLPLAATGRGAYAVFWKNVLHAQRSLRAARGLLIVPVVLLFVWLGDGGERDDLLRFAGMLLIGGAVTMTLLGPLGVRNDLRLDLRHIDQLRTYPLPGRDLVAAEVAAATVTLTAPQLVVVALGLGVFAGLGSLSAAQAVLLGAAAVVVLPLVNALALLIQNVLALLYPSWVHSGGRDTAGMEAVGQNMIVMAGTLLLLALFAVPPLAAGALVGAPLVMLIGAGAAPIGVIAAVAAAAVELLLLIAWLGRLYDRTDPVAAGLLH